MSRSKKKAGEGPAREFVNLNGDLVRQDRLKMNITQAKAAEGCGIDFATYKKAEAGKRIETESAKPIAIFYGRDDWKEYIKPEQTEAQSEADEERLKRQALGTNESSIEEEQHNSRRNTLNVRPTTQVVKPMDDDEQRSFSLLGVGGLDAIVEFAYKNGFVLFSEQDVKQFFLRLADTVSKDDEQSRFIHTIVELYSRATDGPAGLYVTVNNGAALNRWVAKQIGRICERMDKSDQDLVQKITQGEKAPLLAEIPSERVIASMETWHILEQLIVRKTKGKSPWWQKLDLLVRKGDLSFRTAENIKMFHIVLRTVSTNGEFANALDDDVLVAIVVLGFLFSTKLTGISI